jgi:hypothetical protein
LLIACGGGTLLVAGLALALIVTTGLPQRYDPATRRLAMAAYDTNPMRASCDRPTAARMSAGRVCRIGPAGEPRFALIGDSFADALYPGVARAANETGVAGIVMTFSGCAPLPDVSEAAGHCRDDVQAGYALIAQQRSLRTVVLIGRWPTMVSGRRDGLLRQPAIVLRDAQFGTASVHDNTRVIARGLVRAARSVGPAQLLVVTGMPEQHVNVPQAATLARMFGWPQPSLPRAVFDARQSIALSTIAQAGMMLGHPLATLDMAGAMCAGAACPSVAGGAALYSDDNHPSRTFAKQLAGAFTPILAAAGAAPGLVIAPTLGSDLHRRKGPELR